MFELKEDPLKTTTNKNYNVDFASLAEKKPLCDFAKQMNFVVKTQGKKSTRDRTLIKLPKSSSILASGVSRTIFFIIRS